MRWRFAVIAAILVVLASGFAAALDLYFEPPRNLTADNIRFPTAVSDDRTIGVVFQEVDRRNDESGEIFLSVATSADGREWTENPRFVGPIEYSGENVPFIYSARLRNDGTFFVAYAATGEETRILRSDDGGESFTETARIQTDVTTVAPRLFVRDDGGLFLFVNQSIGIAQRILLARSDDGTVWTEFERLEDDEVLSLNFLPHHTSHEGREYVVFQSLVSRDDVLSFQLYLKFSEDAGATWSDAIPLTETLFNPNEAQSGFMYDNQRPFISVVDGRLTLVWERRFQISAFNQVYIAEIDEDGRIVEGEPVTERTGTVASPSFTSLDGEPYVLWFTNPAGNSRVAIARRERGFWSSRFLSPVSGRATFTHVLAHRGRLHVLWQNRLAETRAELVYLEPDQRVLPPTVRPVNFARGRRSGEDTAVIAWDPPPDPSGIRGYSYVWSRDSEAEPVEELLVGADVRSRSFEADTDGPWYLRIIATDLAGNWSDPSTIEFYRDTTPPEPVVFRRPRLDELGYLASNTFRIEWAPPEDDDVAGYSYTVRLVGDSGAEVSAEDVSMPAPPRTILTTEPAISRRNVDNGVWAISVAPIDTVGNVGEPTTLIYRTNKYVPITQVQSIEVQQDILGRYSLTVLGRGYTANGRIRRVLLDRDGVPPYDYEFLAVDGDFLVRNDRRLEGPVIDLIRTGEYRVGLDHPERGIFFTQTRLSFRASGTITFGDYTLRHAPAFVTSPPRFLTLPTGGAAMWLILILLGVTIVFSSTRIVAIVGEATVLKTEARELITGRGETAERQKERIRRMRIKGIGLRLKFTFFVVVLVISIVVFVAVILGNTALERQEDTLGLALVQRIEVLMESVASSARQFLPTADQNAIELSVIPAQSDAMPEATYITITGARPGDADFSFIWGTNDPVLRSIGTPEELPDDDFPREIDTERYQPAGRTRLTDPISELIPALEDELNTRARELIGARASDIDELNRNIVNLREALIFTTDQERLAELEQELEQYDTTRRQLENEITMILSELSATVMSYPEFDPLEIDRDVTQYVFYKPILFRVPGEPAEDARYYRGMVRMGVTTQLILEEIAATTQNLIVSTAGVAIVAVVLGVIGALILATIVVIPINRLVRGVELIRDTDDKEQLADHVIRIKSRDELSVLADTVNTMTQGLVRAAIASKDLTVGKEVQKMFIPLELNKVGDKSTFGRLGNERIEFFGYYEGAKGVSGDYFDYRRLDEEHYAIIKCDVAGKGVAAALIMVEVATLFLNYFRAWNAKTVGFDLTPLVTTINDLVEERGFKGRFAAFTLALVNERTGVAQLCNAGDKELHIYRTAERKVVQTSLPPAPAAGVFSSDMMRDGFKQVSMTIDPGDVMVLFTDGIEEAKRVFLDSALRPYQVTEEDVQQKRFPEGVIVGTGDEELGIPRIHAVISALMSRRKYRLEKVVDPFDDILEFDFTACEPTAENLVLAMTAVEKVFRVYPDPRAGENDRIYVDKVVDSFLKKTFLAYDKYFGKPLPDDPESDYREYSHIKEDDQYDDLTILAIRKK